MPADGSPLRPFGDAPAPEELARYPANDWGNGMRLIRLAGGVMGEDGQPEISACRLLYLSGAGWIGFNGRFWDREHGDALARRLAHETARGLVEQTAWIETDDFKPTFSRFARESGNAGRTGAMLTQAQPYLTVALEVFDRDPLALNVANGTLKLRAGAGDVLEAKLAPHDPADRITRLAEVDYDPRAAAPLFERVVGEGLPEDGLRGFLQRAVGYGATGLTREQVMFMLQGKGRDSKSTIMDALRETLGGYGGVASVTTFLDQGPRGGADASPDLARLAGELRFVSIVEPNRGAKLNEGLIKSWTSGSPIVARELRQSLFEFRPKGKLFLEVNSKPKIGNDDDGTWRRLMPIPFRHQVPEGRIDRTIPDKLKAERSGILNWILEGVRAYLVDGLLPPAEVLEVLDDYRKGSSSFGEWFAERVEVDPEATTPATVFYTDYKAWCDENGVEKPSSQRTFGEALSDRQIIRRGKGGDGKVLRKGGRLRPTWVRSGDGAAADRERSGAGGPSGGTMSDGREEPPVDLYIGRPEDWAGR